MFFDLIFRQRLAVIVISAVVLGLSAYGTTRLELSTDNRIFYGDSNPYYLDYLQFESEFTANDNILFVIAAPFTILEGRYAEAIHWLSVEAGSLDHTIRVDSLANYPHPTSGKDSLSVESLLNWGCPNNKCTQKLAPALKQKHLKNRLVSEDGTATGVVATVSIERGSVGEIQALHSDARNLSSRFKEKYPEFEIFFTGGVPMMAAFAEATAKDLSLLLPVALIVVSVLLVFVLGSLRLAGAIILLGLLSITTTLGIAGWGGHILNNATSIVPLIVFTLVVTSSMHIAVHFSRNMDNHPDRSKAVVQARASLSSSLIPITLSAATSAVSLCSLWFVDSPPLRQLGLLSAAGVVVGFTYTVVLLPIMLSAIPRVSETRLGAWVQGTVNKYARQQEQRKDGIAAPAAFLSLCILGLAVLHVNDDFVRFFDESVPFRAHTDRATELLAGPNHIEVVLSNPGGTVFDPQFLSYLDQVAEWLRNEKVVANAHSFSDVMEQVSQAFTNRSVSEISSSDELAQLFLVYELSLQIGQTNTDLINSAQNAARISVLLEETTSNQIQNLEEQIYRTHQAQASQYELTVTGENIPVAHLSWMNIESMVKGIFLSLAFTSLVIGITFRSFRLGVVALLATVLPVLAGFGAWGWIRQEIGIAATAVIALTVGVVVDDAAHYIYRFLDGRNRLELDRWSSAAYATHRAGAAIVSTSLVMTAGLALLLLSSFEVNSSFGSVACLIIATALLFNLSLLPRLTSWAVSSHPQQITGVVK